MSCKTSQEKPFLCLVLSRPKRMSTTTSFTSTTTCFLMGLRTRKLGLLTRLTICQPLSHHPNPLALDLPGFGQSEPRNGLRSPGGMRQFLIGLIAEGGLNTLHSVAPDVGTSAALFAAALQPGKLRSLVIGSGAT